MRKTFSLFGNKIGKTQAILFLELLTHHFLSRKLLPSPWAAVLEAADVPLALVRKTGIKAAIQQHQQFQLLCYLCALIVLVKWLRVQVFIQVLTFFQGISVSYHQENDIKQVRVISPFPSFQYSLQRAREGQCWHQDTVKWFLPKLYNSFYMIYPEQANRSSQKAH